MRNEGAARERNVVGFDLGGVEDAQEECKVGPHAEEEPNMDCESDGGEDGERVRLLPKPPTPSKAEWERHVVSHMPFRDWCRHCVAGRGLEPPHQSRPEQDDQYPLVCIDYGHRRCHTDVGLMCLDAVAAFGQAPETEMIFIEAPEEHRAVVGQACVVAMFESERR